MQYIITLKKTCGWRKRKSRILTENTWLWLSDKLFDWRNKPKIDDYVMNWLVGSTSSFVRFWKHKQLCTILNYIKWLLNLAFAVARCVPISVFSSLVCIPVSIASFAVGLKTYAIPARI